MQYRLLGPLTALRAGGVRGTGEVVDLGPPKQRAVLALLALNRGRIVATDRLIDALWAEDPPASALTSLHAYISNLRRALRDESGAVSPIVRRAPGYVLEVPDDQLDVTRFLVLSRSARQAAEAEDWGVALQHVEEALALWRGPLLEDLRDAPWVDAEAQGLAELRTECRETRVSALLADGRVTPALVEAQALRGEEPLRERACWLVLIALHRAGRSPEALEEYRAYARRLDDELGLEPGAELRELQVAILRQEPALAAWPRSPGWSGARGLRSPTAAADVPSEAAAPSEDLAGAAPALVGREREGELLDAVVSDARAGAVRWLVLTGPAGIGKTRLAQELSLRVRRAGGADVWARCPDERGAPAWWPIRQLVRALGSDPESVLVPPPGADTDEARFAVYERVLELLQASTRRAPLAVVVDDVQWADPTSVRCLAYLAGALRNQPIAMTLTIRDEEDRGRVAPLLTALARTDGNRQVTVPSLGEHDVLGLASQVAGETLSGGEAAELARRTGGNPLFVSEYARLPRAERTGDGMPLAVRSVLGRRLAGLDPDVLTVLRAAAVIGDAVDMELLAATTRLEPDVLADRLDDAFDERIIVAAPGAGGYAFAHGLLREEVLAATPPIRRRRLHARVAELLADATDGERLSSRARHLQLALPLVEPAAVLSACRAAAVGAANGWSSETAAGWWQAALEAFDLLPAGAGTAQERDDLLVARVEALARAGRGQTVLDVVDGGLLDAVRDGRLSAAGRLAAALLRSTGAWPWVASGDDAEPLRRRLSALEPLVAEDPVARLRMQAAISVGNAYHPDGDLLDAMSAEPIATAERLGDPDALADALLGRLLTYSSVSSRSHESVELMARLGALPHAEARVDAATAHSVATMHLMNLGDVAGAEEHLRRGIVESDLLRLPSVRLQLRWMEGSIAQWHGDFAEARRQYAAAVLVHERSELHSSNTADLAGTTLRWQCGTLDEITEPPAFEPDAWRAAIAAAHGEPGRAAELLQDWLAAPMPEVWFRLGHHTLLAHVAADLALRDPAERLIGFLEPHLDRIANIGHVGELGCVALASARLHLLLGDPARAHELVGQATAIAARNAGRPALVRCRILAAQLDGDAAALGAAARDAGALGMRGVRDAALA